MAVAVASQHNGRLAVDMDAWRWAGSDVFCVGHRPDVRIFNQGAGRGRVTGGRPQDLALELQSPSEGGGNGSFFPTGTV